MPTITVLDKIYGSNSVANFENHYCTIVEGLEVELQLKGKNDRGWIQLEINGNDTPIALSLLEQKIGLAPSSADELQKFSVLKGRIVSLDEKSNQLNVDLGLNSPKLDAIISEKDLQAQLADGKQIPIKELTALFCLLKNFPVEVKLLENVNQKGSTVRAVLSDAQISLFKSWVGFRFDRLIILGASFSKMERALNGSRHGRDIIKTEQLGALEHAVLCKLGTHAVGLIPKIGRYMKSSVVLAPFSPKKIIKKIGSQAFDE